MSAASRHHRQEREQVTLFLGIKALLSFLVLWPWFFFLLSHSFHTKPAVCVVLLGHEWSLSRHVQPCFPVCSYVSACVCACVSQLPLPACLPRRGICVCVCVPLSPLWPCGPTCPLGPFLCCCLLPLLSSSFCNTSTAFHKCTRRESKGKWRGVAGSGRREQLQRRNSSKQQ